MTETYVEIWKSRAEYDAARNYDGSAEYCPDSIHVECFHDADFLNSNWLPSREMSGCDLRTWVATRLLDYSEHAEPLLYDDVVELERFKEWFHKVDITLECNNFVKVYDNV